MSPAALAQQNGPAVPSPGGDSDWNPVGPKKEYLVPALEIIGFDTVLNRVDRALIKNTTDCNVSVGSWRRNLRSSWRMRVFTPARGWLSPPDATSSGRCVPC